MIGIDSVYGAFGLVSAALFWRLPVHAAILVTFFGGWLLLPVGRYPPIDPEIVFPWWITGLALPGEMMISKAWIVPAVALAGALAADPGRLRTVRPCWADLPVMAWCLWPLAVAGVSGAADMTPPPAIASLYLAGCWGVPWLLGRLWFGRSADQLLVLRACVWSGLACLPFAVLEGATQIRLYQGLYGAHPFSADGIERYVGYRPLGFFEHGNQYGLWVSVAALAAVWLAFARDRTAQGAAVALLVTLIALASQSVGALLLCTAGLLFLAFWRSPVAWTLLLALVLGAILAVALHLSGLIPLRWIAKETEIGQLVVSGFRSLGRGSFTWRISQDLKAMALIEHARVTGTMIWDWWRPAGIRPWGLWLLLIGQFGLAGFTLAYGTVFATAARILVHLRGARIWTAAMSGAPLALIILVTLADSMLNAFIYFPALLMGGALAAWRPPADDLLSPTATRHA